MAKKGTNAEGEDIYKRLGITREGEKKGIGYAQERNKQVLDRIFSRDGRRKKAIIEGGTDRR